MDSLTLISITLGGFLVVFLLATVLTLPFRSKENASETMVKSSQEMQAHKSSAESSWLGILFEHISRPLTVLIVTFLILKLARDQLQIFGIDSLDERYIQAWYLFWIALLFFNCNEALGRLFYYVRKQSFPLSSLFLFLLRLLLIGATAFSILHFVLDFDTSKLLASTAVVAAVVGIALREVLSNFLAGVSMNLVGTVEPLQWISIGDKEGEIIHRNWRETRLRTTGGHILIIPNSHLAGSVLNNMSWHSSLRRHQLTITLVFNASPQAVKKALVEAAMSVHEVDCSTKLPDAHVHEYRDYGVVYQLRFWSRTFFDRSHLEGLVRERIWYQLRRCGLEIPFPQGGDLSVASVNHNLTEKEPPGERNLRLLQKSGFLEQTLGLIKEQPILSSEEIARFAAALQYRIFGEDEVIFQQGQVGSVCYIVVSGHLIGATRYEGMTTTQGFQIHRGELVGEMALLTGLPRSSTVRAQGDEVELLEISKVLFDQFLENPAIGNAISNCVAGRSKQLFEELQFLEPGHRQQFNTHLQSHPLLHKLKEVLTSFRAS